MNILERPRRIRQNPIVRGMVRETRIPSDSLVYPIFVIEGENIKEEIPSMPEQYRYSVDRLGEILQEVTDAGVKSILLFGIPKEKDSCGSGAWSKDGIVQKALRYAKKEYPSLYYITDVCMCEYTDHGHCGILDGANVDNDKTLEVLVNIAISHVEAGADMIAPSDMMDGRIKAIRMGLDKAGYEYIPMMSYAVKYASGFYGPFREAAGSAPSFGDRKSYQMDYHNKKEAVKEVFLDNEEGADILMVKPGMAYLDIVNEIAKTIQKPIAIYSVSGEYAMIKAASKAGYMDEEAMICETAVCMYRAGASILITYYAKELAQLIKEGRIG